MNGWMDGLTHIGREGQISLSVCFWLHTLKIDFLMLFIGKGIISAAKLNFSRS